MPSRPSGSRPSTEGELGYPPVTIRGGRLRGAEVRPPGHRKQPVRLLAPDRRPLRRPERSPSSWRGGSPPSPTSRSPWRRWGPSASTVALDGAGRYVVKSGQRYRGREYRIEGDVSSASYFFLAAALLKGRIRVENINPRTRQGDIGFLAILERLGCRVIREENAVEIAGGELPGGEMTFDLGAMPDMVPTLAVLCALRPGRSLIRNVAHLRLKESDRLAALVNELRKTGIAAEELADGIAVTGGKPRGATIETYNDHRIAMSFAVLGLAVPGMKIEGEECVGKSFPGFWEALEEGLSMNIILIGIPLYRQDLRRPAAGGDVWDCPFYDTDETDRTADGPLDLPDRRREGMAGLPGGGKGRHPGALRRRTAASSPWGAAPFCDARNVEVLEDKRPFRLAFRRRGDDRRTDGKGPGRRAPNAPR